MIPDTRRPLIVAVESNEFGYVALLAQKDSAGKERPCSLYLREWGPVEARHNEAERHLLAARMAVSYWRHYLSPATFELRWAQPSIVQLSKQSDLHPIL